MSSIKKELNDTIAQANSVINDRLSNRYSYQSDSVSDALGFPYSITFKDYKDRYKRQDIANRVVSFPVNYTWKDTPVVFESKEKETQFEKAYEELAEKVDLYTFLRKFDLLACLGRFSLLFLGFNDEKELYSPVDKATELLYVEAVSEEHATILQWDIDPSSRRYGLPVMYQVTIAIDDNEFYSKNVHWSRLIHLAENTLDSNVYGIPYLEPIFNRLLGLEKLCGGSPEMYWMGARPGYAASSVPDSVINRSQQEDLKTQLSDFVNNMKRWLYVEGLDIKSLSPQVVTPKDHVAVQIEMISAYSGIPVRILIGSERGELASTQDERAWLSLVEDRRDNIAKKLIMVPLIDRLIAVGVLPAPEDKYYISWNSLLVMSEKDKAEIGGIKTKALSVYVNSVGADLILPPEMFMKQILGMSDEEIELSIDMVSRDIKDDSSIV